MAVDNILQCIACDYMDFVAELDEVARVFLAIDNVSRETFLSSLGTMVLGLTAWHDEWQEVGGVAPSDESAPGRESAIVSRTSR